MNGLKFMDDYQLETCTLPGNSENKWVILEPEHATLKTRRTQLGMTQQDVANAAGIQLRQYQRFESGERSIRSSSLKIGLSICSVLRLDPYRFLPNYAWMGNQP